MSKPKIIKDFEKLDKQIREQIKLCYPNGFSDHLITYTNRSGAYASALPFETDEKYYLVRMTRQEAHLLIDEDDDFDERGNLKANIRDYYEDKYPDIEPIAQEDLED